MPARRRNAITMRSTPRCAPCWPVGELGQHNGLPASVIVTTTLAELEAAAGRGLTGGGTILPMSDVIRLGSPRPPLSGDLRERAKPWPYITPSDWPLPHNESCCTPRSLAPQRPDVR